MAFGLLVAASIGPIAILILTTAASRGLWPGVFAALGAALADFVYALLAFSAGAWALPLVEAQARAIRIGSSLLLIGFALAMFRQSLRTGSAQPATPRAASGTLLPTFMLTLLNPATFVIFAGFVPQLPVAGAPALALWLAFGLFLGSLIVQLALALSGRLLGATLPARGWQRSIGVTGAAGILAFGIAGLWSTL
ncbi:MAG TPA: LysE family transporter [Ktedonobacterales bacterium]|nr:LysE family transporter [Ktedonobacterales bacterium]